MDSSTDPFERHRHADLKLVDAIELLRPRDFVGRHLPTKAARYAEALTFGEKCLAATQLLLRTQILGRFSLFARRDVLERHQNPAFGMARERQRTGVKNERPWTLSRKDEIRLVPSRWTLTLGSKFEHNDYSGFNAQPNVRVLFSPSARQVLWSAASRALRVPSRVEVLCAS